MKEVGRHEEMISVVVPLYNEEENIIKFHKDLLKALKKTGKKFEVIYVDDRSSDRSLALLKNFARDKRIRVLSKQGQRGKAFSLIEGFEKAKGSLFVMIDGDGQYPPDKIPEFIEKLKTCDVVAANRKDYQESFLRKTMSGVFRFIFGKLLFGLNVDIQAGLKAFKREVFETVKFKPDSSWTFDLEFLYRIRQSGFSIGSIDITFLHREFGKSKVNIINSTLEIAFNALVVRMKKTTPLIINPQKEDSMIGAGVGFGKQKFITHTTLDPSISAMQTFTPGQKIFFLLTLGILIIGFVLAPIAELRILVTLLSLLYFLDTIFNLALILRSLRKPDEIRISDKEISVLRDEDLPIYSILCPLYKEAHVVPQFLKGIERLDWPKDRLDVLFLLEDDDKETIAAFEEMDIPAYSRKIIVPHSIPKTKPKACNYGLAFAKGDYLVIFDAEDIPDADQLKKAYLGFKHVPENVKCLQAKLNFYNSRQNLLTKFFTAEYSLWFDLTLTGLQAFNSAIPLGGTSNHFKAGYLKSIRGWDPFNVTEDADLGVRLFKEGHQTAIIDSTTMEEATSNVRNWLRQRSRWIKGYMQTYLVHMRNYWKFLRKKGLKSTSIFQLTVGGKILFILINPVMWLVTFVYFAFYSLSSPLIEKIYFPPISYIAVISWIFGNFLFLYYYMVAIGKREQWFLAKYVFMIPFYWAMMSTAASIALYQLIFKPYYWEKTVHGFHLGKKKSSYAPTAVPVQRPAYVPGLSAGALQPAYSLAGSKGGSVNKNVNRTFQSANRKASSFNFPAIPLLVSLSIVTLGALDILLANHYLPSAMMENYLFMAVPGKLIIFMSPLLGYLFTEVLTNGKNLRAKFSGFFFFTFFFSWAGFVGLGLEGDHYLSLFGQASDPLLSALPFYTFASMCFALSMVFVIHNLRKSGSYVFGVVSLMIASMQIFFMDFNHSTYTDFGRVLAYLGLVDLIWMFFLQANSTFINVLENNLNSIFGIFRRQNFVWKENDLRILIFNWRDTKHVFAGGAEVYVHEIARRWARDGNNVTLFCGNDNKSPSNEVLEGVSIVRRGGTYTVYVFALIYYLLRFAGKYDVIIDCENGIPFFTPLFTRKPVILLVHHVHQEIFRVFLKFPLHTIARALEGRLMPWVYKNRQVVTVSDSSKESIIRLGFTKSENISIVRNGVSESLYVSFTKTKHPSFIYLGRLKEYKNVDVAIRAFSRILKKYPSATLEIVGRGEKERDLKRLVETMGMERSVNFHGKVSEKRKGELLSRSWVALQPSTIEGWGITVIEANAAGTPVIASRVNGLQDSVIEETTGLLVQAGNVFKFSKAMMRLVEDEDLRKRLSQSGHLWARNFDWDKSAGEFYTLIRRNMTDGRYTPRPYGDLVLSANK